MGGLAALLAMQVACGAEEEVAAGRVVGIDRMTQPLLAGEIVSIGGTYGAGCVNRASGTWFEPVSGAGNLTVVLNNTACVLTLTTVNTTGVVSGNPPFTAVPPIALDGSYKLAASTFTAAQLEFYANAFSSTTTYPSDFTITLLYSDDSTLATASNTAAFAIAVSSVTAQSVQAPQYTLAVTGLVPLTDIDDVVVSASGNAVLTDAGQDGQSYVVLATGGLATYQQIAVAYAGGTERAFQSNIPASEFTLTGADLTAGTTVRTLIISNLENNVRSYQVFAITFNRPIIVP